MFFYKIDEKTKKQMREELAERRAADEASQNIDNDADGQVFEAEENPLKTSRLKRFWQNTSRTKKKKCKPKKTPKKRKITTTITTEVTMAEISAVQDLWDKS